MAISIAISGKGGTGKTTLSAMMIRSLIGRSPRAVLAVDADPNSCLGITLGVEAERTIGALRDDVLKQRIEPGQGIGKLEAFGYACEQSLTEAKGYDLLTMGQPEGPGCYCAANNTLRAFLSQLTKTYGYVLTDNEAGMEHLSRLTNSDINLLVIVAEPTKVGVVTAQRILELTKTLPISIGEVGVIWNRVRGDVDIELDGIRRFGTVPFDEDVYDAAVAGQSVFELNEESTAFQAVQGILNRLLEKQNN